jgi:hypothetical protein
LRGQEKFSQQNRAMFLKKMRPENNKKYCFSLKLKFNNLFKISKAVAKLKTNKEEKNTLLSFNNILPNSIQFSACYQKQEN